MSGLAQVGPHAAYVLAAYGLSAAALVALTASSVVAAWRWRRRAQARDPARRA